MIKKNVGIVLLLLLAFNAFNSFSQTNLNIREINFDKFKEKFDERFCKNKNPSACQLKWKNMKQLLTIIKADQRVNNIGIASFFLATVYTETEIKYFAPTKEIKGKANIDRPYWKTDPVTGQQYFGRGWVQLTHKENYKKASDILKVDFINNPDLILEPKYAYEIMYQSTMNGWLEFYRADNKGKKATTIPIKLTDFIDKNGNLDYSLTRAVINANGGKSVRFEYKKGCYIPPFESLDASEKNKEACIFFEKALRYSIGLENENKIKLSPLKETKLSSGCFLGAGGSFSSNLNEDSVFFNIDGFDEKFIALKETKKFPAGFIYGFTNSKYKLYIKEKSSKKGDGCIIDIKYNIIIMFNDKKYLMNLDGFCGC